MIQTLHFSDIVIYLTHLHNPLCSKASTEPPGYIFQLHWPWAGSKITTFFNSFLNSFEFQLFCSPFNSKVSPLFQKLEVDQIEALKKEFGGQQVFDVYDA